MPDEEYEFFGFIRKKPKGTDHDGRWWVIGGLGLILALLVFLYALGFALAAILGAIGAGISAVASSPGIILVILGIVILAIAAVFPGSRGPIGGMIIILFPLLFTLIPQVFVYDSAVTVSKSPKGPGRTLQMSEKIWVVATFGFITLFMVWWGIKLIEMPRTDKRIKWIIWAMVLSWMSFWILLSIYFPNTAKYLYSGGRE